MVAVYGVDPTSVADAIILAWLTLAGDGTAADQTSRVAPAAPHTSASRAMQRRFVSLDAPAELLEPRGGRGDAALELSFEAHLLRLP
jgi:hypothetical protein